MNILYKLTLVGKEDNPKYYVGCKSECSIQLIDSIPTIVSLKTGRPYYGSSRSPLFLEDCKKYEIKAEIIEQITNRDDMLVIEHEYLKKNLCAESPEYYNITNGIPRVTTNYVPVNRDMIINSFNETVIEFSISKSSVSKRDNTAISLGFKNMSELAFHIYSEFQSGKTSTEISASLSREKHFASRFISPWDMPKANKEIEKSLESDVRSLYSKGASLHFISKELDIELPSVRYFLGTFINESSGTVAYRYNKSTIEFTQDILDKIGKEKLSISEVATSYGLTVQAVYRYIERYIQSLYD